jgi:hypothetical protein
LSRRVERRSRQRAANRTAILEAARRVAAREGAGALSLRAVAGEAGYAPASVYEYFRNRAELVLALAAEDLGGLARSLKEGAQARGAGTGALQMAAKTVLEVMLSSGALPAAAAHAALGRSPDRGGKIIQRQTDNGPYGVCRGCRTGAENARGTGRCGAVDGSGHRACGAGAGRTVKDARFRGRKPCWSAWRSVSRRFLERDFG